MNLIETSFKVPTTSTQEPSWSTRIDRWFQLDEEGFALCHALVEWQKIPGVVPKPNLIVHASLQGSWQADLDFVRSGAESPSKFVYTLPSVPMGVLAQFLSWNGSMYNFTGESSWEHAENFTQQFITNWKMNESKTRTCSSREIDLISEPFVAWLVCIKRVEGSSQWREVQWKQI